MSSEDGLDIPRWRLAASAGAQSQGPTVCYVSRNVKQPEMTHTGTLTAQLEYTLKHMFAGTQILLLQ